MHLLPGLLAQRRPPRGRRGLLLLAAVVALHAWLIDTLGRRAPAALAVGGASATQRAALQTTQTLPGLQTLPGPHTLPAPPRPGVAAATAARPANGAEAGPGPARERSQPAADVARLPGTAAAEPRTAELAPSTSAAPDAPGAPAAPDTPRTNPAPLADGAPAPAAVAGAGEPPPVYATRLPAPVQLQYALSYSGQAGAATLSWHSDGQQYQLALEGRGALQPLVEQISRGGFDAAGLAPERFTDRRRGRYWRAANFRRDAGRIVFSGPAVAYPAWPGAQDRLGWIAQVAAIAGAAPVPLGDVEVFVVDARGAGERWRFVSLGATRLATPLGMLETVHLRREAPSPESLQVDVWLDPARGHWPARLRFTAPRRGDVFELLLAAEPGLPP